MAMARNCLGRRVVPVQDGIPGQSIYSTRVEPLGILILCLSIYCHSLSALSLSFSHTTLSRVHATAVRPTQTVPSR